MVKAAVSQNHQLRSCKPDRQAIPQINFLPIGSAMHLCSAIRLTRVVACFAASLTAVAGPSWAADVTFSNPALITIPEFGAATPYPATVTVTGVSGLVTKVTATLTGFTHTAPAHVGALLVGPGGQKAVLFNGVSSGSVANNLIWTFDDDALAPLPSFGPHASGAYRPSNSFPGDTFANPAPAGPYPVSMSVFDGVDPNGTWSLYVQDFGAFNAGSINSGWSVTLSTTPVPEPAAWALMLVGMGAVATAVRRNAAPVHRRG